MGERRKSTCLLPGRQFSGSVSFQPVERTRILSLPPPYMAPGAERTPVHRRAILLDARTRTDSFKGRPQRHTAILPAQIQGFKQTRRLHPSDHWSGRHRFRTHRHPVCKLTRLRNKTPALWVHKVGVYKSVDFLHKFDGCESSSLQFFCGIRSSSSRPVHIDGFTETQGSSAFLSHFKKLFCCVSHMKVSHNLLGLRDTNIRHYS